MVMLKALMETLKNGGKSKISSANFRDTKMVLLAGLSGAGKSTLCRKFCDTVTLIELDSILTPGYEILAVGNTGEDPFSYPAWQTFLADAENMERATEFFSREITERIAKNVGRPTIIVGNHFALDPVRKLIEKVLNCMRIENVTRLILDLSEEQIYEQRIRRGNAYDREITRQEIKSERAELFGICGSSGFERVSPAVCAATISLMTVPNSVT